MGAQRLIFAPRRLPILIQELLRAGPRSGPVDVDV
jgi:hypothetical protein